MDKQQVIAFIESQVAAGKITRGDLAMLSGTPGVAPAMGNSDTATSGSKGLIRVLYAIGAIIAIVGVGILVGQNWHEIGFAGRIAVSLGISLIAYVGGLLLRKPEQSAISQIMFVISAALAPLGAYVLLQEANMSFDAGIQAMVALVLAIIFGVGLLISKRSMLVLITIGFISWAYYAFIVNTLGFNYSNYDFLKWATIILGAAYILIGYGYGARSAMATGGELRERKAVADVLYGFGTLAVLLGGIMIGGIFDLVFIALIFAAFYGSVYLRSRAMLIFGAIFLMVHIGKLTSKYFLDSIGWPVALIVVGFLVIGVGYMTYYVNKRYITAQ